MTEKYLMGFTSDEPSKPTEVVGTYTTAVQASAFGVPSEQLIENAETKSKSTIAAGLPLETWAQLGLESAKKELEKK